MKLSHLTPEHKKAFVIAENQLATLGGWDTDVLRIEFEELSELDLDFSLEVTGFVEPQIDAIMFGKDLDRKGDELPAVPQTQVTQVGDLWLLGKSKLLCGDATEPASFVTLLAGEKARAVFTDSPYNVKISGHVTGAKGAREFVMASGEMDDKGFTQFLAKSMQRISENLVPGGVAYLCMDWRHMANMLDAMKMSELEMINLAVWDKGQGGMGSFLRSRHELVFVSRRTGAAHLNRVELGKHGRNRENVWCYPGVNGFGAEKARAREMHSTVKPLALVRDAILDCSARGDLILDLFSGSGTTIIAAHETGRRGAAIDLDPLYVDTGVIRWQDFTGQEARLAATGQTFREVRTERTEQQDVTPPPALPHARPRRRPATTDTQLPPAGPRVRRSA